MQSVPTRVALRATVAVAVLYVLFGAVVILIVSHNLAAAVDQRLNRALLSEQTTGRPFGGGGSGGSFNPGDLLGRRTGGTPLLVWIVDPNGNVLPQGAGLSNNTYPLAEADRHLSGPDTITVSGTEVRAEGGAIGLQQGVLGPVVGGWVVIGEPTAAISQARDTVLIAEVVVLPILLVLVFFGALAVGRRVAEPLERARKRQLEFTADASHELRTPLSVIEAEATLALAMPRTAEAYREGFARVDVESKRLRRLVDDLLWLARFDAAPDPPGAELVDLGVLAQTAVERFRSVAERRSQRLAGSVNGSAASLLTAPPDWLDRLLGVLLDNACRYSADGGQVLVSVTGDGSNVRLCVEDSGPGIPAEERAQVFDRFHRASTTPGGAGLGLAIGDAVVRATGGRWTVGESRFGGASMAVTWPRTSA